MSDKNLRKDAIRYALMGALGGMFLRTTPELIKQISDRFKDQRDKTKTKAVLLAEDKSQEKKADFLPQGMQDWMADAAAKYGVGLASAAATYALLDRVLADNRKDDLKGQLDAKRQDYYARILGARETDHGKAFRPHQGLSVDLGKEASVRHKEASLAQLAAVSAILGIPLGTAWVVKQHLDQQAGSWKTPRATEWYKDFDDSLTRVKRVPAIGTDPKGKGKKDEDELDKKAHLEGYLHTKSASETNMLLNILLADHVRARETGLEGLVKLAATGYTSELRKTAREGFDALLDLPQSYAAALTKSASALTDASLAMGTGFLSHDPEVRGALKTYLCAEYHDMAPTLCKLAGTLEPSQGETILMSALLDDAEQTQARLSKVASALADNMSGDELAEVLLEAPDGLSDVNLAQTLDDLHNTKSASDDKVLAALKQACQRTTES